MKFIALLLSLALAYPVQAANNGMGRVVFSCKDNSTRSFTIYQIQKSQYRALFISYGILNSTETYFCQKVGRGTHFKCENEETEVLLTRNSSRKMTAWFTWKSDLYPRRGPLFSIECK